MMGVETPIPPARIDPAAPRGPRGGPKTVKEKIELGKNRFAPPCLGEGPEAGEHRYIRNFCSNNLNPINSCKLQQI